jgi:hypothetical protein
LPVGSGPLLNGNVGDIRPIFFDGSSKYNSFQSQLQVKGLRGFQGQASFTLGKCFDDGSGAQLGDPFLTSVPSLIFFDRKERHGRCDFDVHKNLSINTLYNFGTPRSDSAIVNHLAGGWQLGLIMTASSGTPFTVVLPNDALGQNSTDPWSFPDRLSGCNPYVGNFRAAGMVYLNSACFAPLTVTAAGPVVGTNGRNSLFGPGLVDFDFTVLKDTRITEKLRAQFRAEFFNLFNHANFQAPNIDGGTSTMGFGANPIPVVLSQTATEGRDIQFGLKLIF